MKKYVGLTLVLLPSLILSCAPPLAGMRVWNIATKNIFITQTIENILDSISGIDTLVFGNLDQLLDKVTKVEDKASLLLQEIDILQSDLVQDLSKTNLLASTIGLLESNSTLLDTSAIFTALDALQTTIISTMDLLNNNLESIVTHIDNITTSEIAYAQTIVSKLDSLDNDVNSVNSLLDELSANFPLTTFFSLTDILQQDFIPIESNLQILDNQIATGFTGTFSVLDQNLLLAQTIESLAHELEVIESSDLTGTYSLLDQLNISVQTMNSLTDELVNTYATIVSAIDMLGSALDQSVSKYIFVESRTSLLTQKLQELIIDPAFSMIDHATSLLDTDISLLAIIYDADLPALTSSIESKLDHIISQQDVQISDLDSITRAYSLIQILPNEIITISKLDKANNILDDVITDAFATESYINAATRINQINDAQNLLNQIHYTASLVPQISSKMTLVNNNLGTTNSTLDVITILAQNNLNTLTSVQSILDAHSFIPQPSASISSSLSVINSQENTLISKLAVVSNLITTANSDAQGLIGDFQATWTILQSIDTKLTQAYTKLSSTDAALQSKLAGLVSYSSVFTVIDTIVRNEATINSQVDVYNSMVNLLTSNINTDFNGVFTTLTAINNSARSSSSTLTALSSKLSNIQSALGIPIYNRTLGTTGITISTSGRYYLAENINFSPVSNITAITIATNNVTLDLAERTLLLTSTSTSPAITLNTGLSNVRIINGTISGFASSIQMNSPSNILLRNLDFLNGSQNDILINSNPSTNIVIDNCSIIRQRGSVPAINFSNSPGTNGPNNVLKNIVIALNNAGGSSYSLSIDRADHIVMKNITILASPFGGIVSSLTQNPVMENCIINNTGYAVAGGSAIRSDGVISGTPQQGSTCKNCICLNNSGGIILTAGGTGLLTNAVIIDNTIINNTSYGIRAQGGGNTGNNALMFNSCIQNGTNFIESIAQPNTYLGNFAFNTNAAGSPSNTNYALPSSNITGKFITISQRTGISGAIAPTYWHNINMLP